MSGALSSTIPIIMTSAGYQPRSPAQLRAALLASVSGVDPGYTADLPGGLIEDVASTDVGALIVMDSAIAEIINSVSPDGANDFILAKLGAVYLGSENPLGLTANGSAFVIFSSSSIGFPIAQGFILSDGTNQYICPQGGIIGSGGSTAPVFCRALAPGTFPILPGTITQLVTPLPSGVTVSVTNPLAGIPGTTSVSTVDYRAAILQAGLASAQGMGRFLKTQLVKVPGVVPRLVSVRLGFNNQWEVICGGGDPYSVANAIWMGIFDINTLTGSVLQVTAISQHNPGKVTTNLAHGLVNGQQVTLATVNPSNYNGTYTATVTSPFQFTIGVDTTGFPAYVSGGIVTPNIRNITVDIIDYPDVYGVTFVNPPQQTVAVTLVWNTTSPFAVDPNAVAQLGIPALVAYVNSIPVGQPVNQFEMEDVFKSAIESLIPPPLISRMIWTVSINGVGTSPVSGTGLFVGDPEGYFQTDSTQISITQG